VLPSFQRFSVDVYIYDKHGLYGADYPRSKYEEYQIEAKEALTLQLRDLLRAKDRDAILDFSFAFKEVRDEYKTLIEEEEGRWVLVYLDVDEETLRQRIRERREGAVDADSAFEVTEEVLARYLEGFQRPENEGETVLKIV
jgi:predicted kinase